MKCKIIEKASQMFLSLGFKSVTMDDISNELAISKKTLYTHFSTKKKLVEESTFFVFNNVCSGINSICCKKQNSIIELFEIKDFVYVNMKDEKTSSQFQLQKFFPDIYFKMKKKHFEVMQSCVEENLTRGIDQGLYRPNINIEFTTRIYFTGLMGIKDTDTFPEKNFNKQQLMTEYLEYHTRAISSTKGLETLEQIINSK
ncbi:hypothetical protein FHR24_000864 [Wenyingzhuangia heitensis]|uniref:HTH tetR-type domain-containing protein n=1 Tax=Wenyingzhuangia heitensis TaxID=1487859 RepID=A0ABX0U9G3_9FLAO|nr:TetR/AcrR family transcriptional regulator [Wenyingzhuangia heitensis]NIJ44425.1 hypothetical protein [Wenyingzhuangia heitensis]